MALIKCPDCGTEISTEAPTCPKCGRPNAPPKKKSSALGNGCGLLVIIVIALGVIGAFFGNDDSSSTGSGSPNAHSAPVKPYITTASGLYQAYRSNEVATQDAIGDRPVELSGFITSIDEDFTGSPVLHLADGDEFAPAGLTLSDSQRAKAANLKRGMEVVVLCRKMIRIMGSPQGSDCHVVSTGR